MTPTLGALQVGGDIFACSTPINGGNNGNANVICAQLRIFSNSETLMIGSNNSQLKIRAASGNGIGFYGTTGTIGNEYMRICNSTQSSTTTAGHIGIGLITPTEKLHVNGSINISAKYST